MITKIKKIMVSFIMIVFLIGFFGQTFISLLTPKVLTHPVGSGSIEKIEYISGIFEFKEIEEVKLDCSVTVDEVFVKVLTQIKKGDKLFKVTVVDESMSIENQEHTLHLKMSTIEAEIQQLLRTKSSGNYDLNELKIRVQEKRQALEDSKELFDEGLISKESFEERTRTLASLDRSLEMLKLSVAANIKGVDSSIETLENQMNALRQKMFVLDRLNEHYLEIVNGYCYAQYDGVVLDVTKGKDIVSDGESIMKVARLKDLTFNIEIPLSDVPKYKLKDRISIKELDVSFSLHEMDQDVFTNIASLECRIEDLLYLRYLGKRFQAEKSTSHFGNSVIKKSSAGIQNLEVGDSIKIYRINSKETLLGEENILEEIEVRVEFIGTEYLAVLSPLITPMDSIVTNIDFNITDGAKVQSWN